MKKIVILGICALLVAVVACKKKQSDPEPVPYTTFKVDGVAKSFATYSRFSKDFCSTSTFCCRFSKDTSATAPQLKFGIPGDPIVGHVYTTGEYRFSCFYYENGVRYDLTDTNPFTVTFTLWEGQGGWAKGVFSGWMKSAENDSVNITNGYFQNTIWTMGTN